MKSAEVDEQAVRDNLNFIKGRVSGWNDAIDACADRAEQLLVEWQSGTASSDVRSVDPKTFGDELRRLKEEG